MTQGLLLCIDLRKKKYWAILFLRQSLCYIQNPTVVFCRFRFDQVLQYYCCSIFIHRDKLLLQRSGIDFLPLLQCIFSSTISHNGHRQANMKTDPRKNKNLKKS